MFKVVVFFLSLTTHQPVDVGISIPSYKDEAECKEHIGEMMLHAARHVAGRTDIGFNAECVSGKRAVEIEKYIDGKRDANGI